MRERIRDTKSYKDSKLEFPHTQLYLHLGSYKRDIVSKKISIFTLVLLLNSGAAIILIKLLLTC